MKWMMRGLGILWISNIISLFHGCGNIGEIMECFLAMAAVTKAGLVLIAYVLASIVCASLMDMWALLGLWAMKLNKVIGQARQEIANLANKSSKNIVQLPKNESDD